MSEAYPRTHASIGPSISYRDRKAAIDWLQRAFGFEPSLVIVGADGELGHAEMTFGNGYIIIGGEFPEWSRFSPASLDGRTTQSLYIRLSEDVDAHCERARAAGAVIQREPQTQPYGDRYYQALDPEGHVWMFAQSVPMETRHD